MHGGGGGGGPGPGGSLRSPMDDDDHHFVSKYQNLEEVAGKVRAVAAAVLVAALWFGVWSMVGQMKGSSRPSRRHAQALPQATCLNPGRCKQAMNRGPGLLAGRQSGCDVPPCVLLCCRWLRWLKTRMAAASFRRSLTRGVLPPSLWCFR